MIKNIQALAGAPAILVDIGNTSVNIATWHEDQLKSMLSVPTDDTVRVEEAFVAHSDAAQDGVTPATVIASVVPTALESVRKMINDKFDREPLVIGDSIPLPMDVGVTDKNELGIDRVCAAFAAYDKVGAACTVVDFGTAVTVDLVDDDGTFLGGSIFPGLRSQLRALSEHTAVLPPNVEPIPPESPFGKNTVEAMQTGVCRGIAGAVRSLVEGYAASIHRWPQVIATGGDLEVMTPLCDFIDAAVSQLTLRGIGRAYTVYLADCGV